MNVEGVTIESDERGFELHLLVDEDVRSDDDGRLILNVQMVAEELYDAVKNGIGPWLAERDVARRDFDAGERERIIRDEEALAEGDHGPWPGESPMDYFQRTGDDEPLREQADLLRDRAKVGE